MSDSLTRRLRAHGRVQGVWFRESMRREAARLGIKGWVRNRLDATVEAVVEGSPQAVETITEWMRRGPEGAHVTRLEVAEEPAGAYVEFEKRSTS